MMMSGADTARAENASESSWRLVYEKARGFMAHGEYSKAADILRVLALAAPRETEIWNALAACHDAEDRSDIGDALRSLSQLIQSQLTPRPS
jgi:Flp pilus assembly protein TadD